MARIYTNGFELNSLTNGVERFGSSAQGSISSTTVRNSTYSWRCNPSAAAMAVNFGLNAGAGTKTVFIRFDFYAVTMPPADALVFLLTQNDLTTTMMRLRGTGSGRKAMNSANTQVGSNIALSTNTWYRIEVKCFSNATTGTIDVLVDGVSAVANTGLNTQGGDINGIQFGSGAATTSEYFIDNVAINDTSGSSQTSYPGEGYVICLRPNAAGDNADFTRGGADSGANWSQCDETTPNDVTDYNVSGTVNHVDMFGMSASGIGASDTVNVVHVGYRIANITSDGAACIQARIIKTASGTVASGTATTALSSTTWRSNATSITAYNPYPITLYADPDASAWTQSTLDSMQCGYKITTGGTNGMAVSAVWAMVDYTPVAAGGLFVNPMTGIGGAAANPL